MKPDNIRFENARYAAKCAHERFNIGTYKEKSQHLVLKMYYEPDTSFHEISVCGHIADIMNGEGIIEIQTKAFSSLKQKLGDYLKDNKVKIVYPCAVKQRVCWTDPDTGETKMGNFRSYPKRIYKLLPELLYISEYLFSDNLSIEVVYTSVSDNRLADGYGDLRKARATKVDIFPEEIIDIFTINNREDLITLLPFENGQTLTRASISGMTGITGRNLWMEIRLLEVLGIIKKTGKKGNQIIYTVNTEE